MATVPGSSTINGGDANFTVNGFDHSSTPVTGSNTLVIGSANNDYLASQSGSSLTILSGGDGNDTVFAGGNNAVVAGGAGNDIVQGDSQAQGLAGMGGAGGDILRGTENSDYFAGGSGNDTIIGNGGNDYLFGGADNDTIAGGAGDDNLYGEAGNDVFQYAVNATSGAASGNDTIADFQAGLDKIDIMGTGELTNHNGVVDGTDLADVLAATEQMGANAMITLADGSTIELLNVDSTTWNAGNLNQYFVV